jgi:hypothetical protein
MNGRAESQPAPSIEFWGDLLRDRSEADVIAFVRRQPELVNVPDAVSSEYALEQAVFHEKCELVQVLLVRGADLEARGFPDGAAAEPGREERR